MLDRRMRYSVQAAKVNARSQGLQPRYGEDIFSGGDYPREWHEVVGQHRAKARLLAAVESARQRGTRLDHTLLASGLHGVGKTTLAKLVAYQLKVGFIEVSGAVSVDEARQVLRGMREGDVLFWDEVHTAISAGKSRAEWLLPFLTDGGLLSAKGYEKMPDITLIAATTDAQRLPQTFLSRFMVQPVLEPYTEEEGAEIAGRLAERMGFGRDVVPALPEDLRGALAQASNGSPREMRGLLVALRDAYLAQGSFDLDLALEWAGLTHDGLNALAQEYLLTLVLICGGTAGEKTIASQLNEPGPLRHTEQLLAQKGFITIEPNGRTATEEGVERTVALLKERGMLDD